MIRRLNVCHISTFLPTQCGIATYVADLIGSLPATDSVQIRLVRDEEKDGEARRTILIPDENSYMAAAQYINDSPEIDLVSIQHENGIYGGNDGDFVLKLAQEIRKPSVTTLHTVRRGMGQWPQAVLRGIAELSTRLVVLNNACAETLLQESVPASKIEVIPHGIPDVPFRLPGGSLRQQLNASAVFVSAGHLRPTKGYHLALQALALFRNTNPDFKYVILGTSQKQAAESADYRSEIKGLIKLLGLEGNVVWPDRYLEWDEMLDWILAADIGLVTYTDLPQTATGVLPLMLGCGRPVVATPFAGALETHIEGLFVAESCDPATIHGALARLYASDQSLPELMISTYDQTRDWTWSRCGAQYQRVFEDAMDQQQRRATAPAQLPHLTIAYMTSRRHPCMNWFFDSLHRETGGEYAGIRLVIVDFWADPSDGEWYAAREKYIRGACHIRQDDLVWVPPKPSVWQGSYRLTRQDWFAASNARNTAICYAPDGWIAFVDDLSVLMPGWLTEVRKAMAGPQNLVTVGAYRKVKRLVVFDGEVVSFEDHPGGHDHRWPHGSDDGPVTCNSNWLYGCSLAAPVDAFLAINGFNELCDGLGLEDCIAGIMLEKKGYSFVYNRRMLTWESEELHTQEPVMKRSDYGVSPQDKSHAVLGMAQSGDGWAENFFSSGGLWSLRKDILSGGSFPIPRIPEREFFTGRPLAEL